MTAASVVPDLTGQVALVTGAARGQGRSHSLALAEAGAAVAVLDICRDLDVPAYSLGTRAELDAVVGAVTAAGGRALPIVADVRDPASVADAVAAVEAEFGRLDVLVNNAAIVTSAPFWELTEAQWCAVVDTNLSGVWRTTKAAAPLLRRSPRGRIVHISSTAGARAVPEFAHYVAAKHGVVGLTRAMAIELAADGVTVNAMLPGAVASPMLDGLADELGLTPDDVHKRWLHDQLLVEVIPPSDVTGALLWLLSDSARHVTGHCLAVDGGALGPLDDRSRRSTWARFDGKVVLITGGARGQGRSHALTFASEGADVAFCDIAAQLDTVPYPMAQPADLDETVKLVEELDRRCVGDVADVRDLAQMHAFVERAKTELGRVDFLLANAGIFSFGTVAEHGPTTWQDMIDTNLTGVFHAMRAVLPAMIEQGYGRIVATSSMAGKTGLRQRRPLLRGQVGRDRAGQVGGAGGRRRTGSP